MNDERWTIVDRLLGAALEREPDERAAFLREACGDDEALRREVESLVAHASSGAGVVSTPAVSFADGIRSTGASMMGRRLGPFEIAAQLGAGGMGEVYRARDTKLGRDVAIKILPRIFTTDPDRRARLDREARLLAALNHPHIGAIYGLEELDGTPALVLELVEGDTLAERLAKGPLAIKDALTIARQIADALDAAHEKGIVHRDLKPANIKITPNGIVKVLDFGLAKATAGETSGPDLTQSPRVTIGGTHDGVILGTAPYMSPEQARGKSVDRRTDVWAFGCVLFEMLTGRVAFAGDTLSDTIAAILERAPEWSALPAATPAPIRRLLLRCLEKDTKRRLRDIGDVRTDIDDVLSGATAPAPTVIAPASAPDARVAALVRRHRGALELAALIVALAAAGAWYLATRDGGTASLLPYDDIVQLTTTGNAILPAISPDDRFIAYVQPDDEGDSLWIRDTTPTGAPREIVEPRAGIHIRGATFTPDGAFVDFLEPTPTNTALWRVPFLGGKPPRQLIDGVHSPVAWSPDRRWMAFIRAGVHQENGVVHFDLNNTQLIRADFDGGNEQVLATQNAPNPRFFHIFDPGALPARPAWSPNGEVIAMGGIGLPGGKPTGYTMFVTVANGDVQAIPQTLPGAPGAWIDNSRLVWNGGNCQGAPRQLSWLSPEGKLLSKLTNDVSNYAGVSLTAGRDSLVTARTDIRVDIWVGDGKAINGGDVVLGAAMPLYANGRSVTWVGDRLLYTARRGGCLALSAFYPEQNKTEDIIPKADSPAGTSDGGTTVYVSLDDDKLGSLWAEDAGGRNQRQLAVYGNWPVVTPGDQRVIYVDGSTQWTYSVSIDGGKPDLIAGVAARTPDVSPDGTSLAFVSPDWRIVVCKLADCSSRSRQYLNAPGLSESLQIGGRIRWTPDQKGIAYVRFDRVEPQPNIWIQPLDGTLPRKLTRFTDGRLILDFAWSRDGGKRLAITRARVTTDVVLFKGLRPPS